MAEIGKEGVLCLLSDKKSMDASSLPRLLQTFTDFSK
ncbi:hypothetical protein CGLO_07162 [Colletotrichum gloeosporioides Cg-14]|uniref:Uncharacterized protein n=1 Tax=Colletotrichum gloeosporioides (strain Cg-14) TaxID=1237896 RepID=T0KCK6_COLGC|nr:hypothetical protein CGLO_07162 [Colletotrichum gloeosporioides Cg-14]